MALLAEMIIVVMLDITILAVKKEHTAVIMGSYAVATLQLI